MPSSSVLTVRIAPDTYRKLKIEAATSGQTLRELVQVALEGLLLEREETRRDEAFGRCEE